MLLNLSDVLSDRHQPINETVQLDMEEFQTESRNLFRLFEKIR